VEIIRNSNLVSINKVYGKPARLTHFYIVNDSFHTTMAEFREPPGPQWGNYVPQNLRC
jgi:hypothetical protein